MASQCTIVNCISDQQLPASVLMVVNGMSLTVGGLSPTPHVAPATGSGPCMITCWFVSLVVSCTTQAK